MSKHRFGVTIVVMLVLALSLVCSTVPLNNDVPLIISPGTDGIATVTDYNIFITPSIVVDANTTFTDVVRLNCPAGYNDTIGIANLTINSGQIKELQIFVNYSSQRIILIHYQDGAVIENNTFTLHSETEAIMGIAIIPTPAVINAGPIDSIYYNIFCSYEVPVVERDVAVLSVVPAKNQTYPSWIPPLNITVTVLNNGTEPANFTVTAYYDTNVIGAPQNVTNLGAGEQLNLTFSWDLTAVAYGLYDIKANATLADDVNPVNNEFVVYDAVKVKIPGDVDGDGLVGGGDLGLLGWAWGTSPGMPKYDQECDFDQDGSIGGGDLGLLGWYWGESVTY